MRVSAYNACLEIYEVKRKKSVQHVMKMNWKNKKKRPTQRHQKKNYEINTWFSVHFPSNVALLIREKTGWNLSQKCLKIYMNEWKETDFLLTILPTGQRGAWRGFMFLHMWIWLSQESQILRDRIFIDQSGSFPVIVSILFVSDDNDGNNCSDYNCSTNGYEDNFPRLQLLSDLWKWEQLAHNRSECYDSSEGGTYWIIWLQTHHCSKFWMNS